MTIKEEIAQLAKKYSNKLQTQINLRIAEMNEDDTSHFLIYRVLGITDEEGKLIDIYQNKGRFLYKYAGSFLEDAAKLCFKSTYPKAGSLRIPNTETKRPLKFEIDCLLGNDAVEIKWRDATTDGDHITKEHTRIQVIRNAGYKPIRVMFYYPNRGQAIKIQKTLETLYHGLSGDYYYGDTAWDYVKTMTKIDLRKILVEIADERVSIK